MDAFGQDRVSYNSIQVDNLKVFYRETGPKDGQRHPFAPRRSNVFQNVSADAGVLFEHQISSHRSGLSGLWAQLLAKQERI